MLQYILETHRRITPELAASLQNTHPGALPVTHNPPIRLVLDTSQERVSRWGQNVLTEKRRAFRPLLAAG